jgi:hypothetical protein
MGFSMVAAHKRDRRVERLPPLGNDEGQSGNASCDSRWCIVDWVVET